MNNAIPEIKSTLEGINHKITEAEDMVSEMEDKMVEINEAERKKELKGMRTTSETSGTMSNIQIIGVSEEEDKRKYMRKYLRR